MVSPNRSDALCAVFACLLLGGCAGTGTVPEDDSWEGFNRGVYAFNNGVDKVVLKPLARGYRFITPNPVERGVSNVFSNLGYPTVIVNNLLQGKGGDAASDLGRFVVNSTLGIAGIFDVAKRIGLEEHDEDFGQTFATWGVPSGPYVMLPFLGPSTLRDAFSMAGDQAFHVRNHLDDTGLEDKLLVLQIITTRAGLLPLDDQINAANDPYLFLREAYLQRRNYLIYDGEPPVEEDEFELDDDFDEDL